MRSYNSQSFVISFFSLSIMLSRSIHAVDVSVIHPFLRLNNIPLYGYATFSLSIPQLMHIWVLIWFNIKAL